MNIFPMFSKLVGGESWFTGNEEHDGVFFHGLNHIVAQRGWLRPMCWIDIGSKSGDRRSIYNIAEGAERRSKKEK